MKYIFLTLSLIFAFSFGFTQNSITVHLKNGTSLIGSGTLKRKFVKVKTSKDAKAKKIKLEEIDSINYSKKGKSTVFYFFKNDENDLVPYLQLVADGKMNLYRYSMLVSTGYGAYESSSYYLKRDTESTVITLGGGTVWDNFKKDSAQYFKDCPELVNNISESKKGFAKKDIERIVEFYNSECH